MATKRKASPKRKSSTKTKSSTKEDLESKIAKLEKKLEKLSTQLDTKPAEKPKPAEVKPAEVKPAEVKPAEVKPAEVKPAEVKPAEAPKPAETTAQPPVTVQEALENAYNNAPMSDSHQYRAKVAGYLPAPNRYFVRLTAPVGTVPTSNWNDQKVQVTGYTQPSNQYFATRPRLAYHPAEKRFGSFSGVNMSVEGISAQAKSTPPPEVIEVPEVSQTTSNVDDNKSKVDKLADYEADYMKRLEQRKIDEANEEADAQAAEAENATSNKKSGALPKGFEAKSEPEAPKSSKGTLPKGF